ncbi:hypothetical protein SAMN05216293_2221 [Flagellimonas taeanensis]|uniref:Uncharacterized protein n=1 Tax=Flagellimonas taeanensis TaxID=1005926 RepID=A0A1M6WA44_9FLAO|nr:hypothetical protein SAMN05216293_2221 [Allomuricauda taeanensis]
MEYEQNHYWTFGQPSIDPFRMTHIIVKILSFY